MPNSVTSFVRIEDGVTQFHYVISDDGDGLVSTGDQVYEDVNKDGKLDDKDYPINRDAFFQLLRLGDLKFALRESPPPSLKWSSIQTCGAALAGLTNANRRGWVTGSEGEQEKWVIAARVASLSCKDLAETSKIKIGDLIGPANTR